MEKIIAKLRRSGYRITPARRALIALLIATRAPLSADKIQATLKRKNIRTHKTTVYRELAFLKDEGIAGEIIFGDGKTRYEIAAAHHHHLVCTGCRAVTDIECSKKINALFSKAAHKVKFNMQAHSLEIFGVCQNCH